MPELKRKIFDELVKWREEANGHYALLIEGARRVGKTYIAELLGGEYYRTFITVDFSKASSRVFDAFNNNVSNDELFNVLSIEYGKKLYERESLIIFDEIQLCPKARQAIKRLVEDGRYDYIETGSLVSIKQNTKDILIPSEEAKITLYPFDFEEFLWATGDETTMSIIKEHFHSLKPLGNTLNRSIMKKFREYIIVGGMPQAILEYISSHKLDQVDEKKRRILELYRDDIAKFGQKNTAKIEAIFDQIPAQLERKEKKFRFSRIDGNARTRTYENAFMWLEDAKVIVPAYNCTNPNAGLKLYSDRSTMKIYMMDTGLLVTQAFYNQKFYDNNLYKALLDDRLEVDEGMLMENVVAQLLVANNNDLFFYSRIDRNDKNNTMEIDFLVLDEKGKVCPIEVKSANYRRHVSLDKFSQKFHHKLGNQYILYTGDVMIKDGIIHLPLYMAMML